MFGITLEAIPGRQFDGVGRVECSVAIVPETVARIHEVKYFGRFLQVCYIQWQHAYGRGEARRECKEINQESKVNAYQEANCFK